MKASRQLVVIIGTTFLLCQLAVTNLLPCGTQSCCLGCCEQAEQLLQEDFVTNGGCDIGCGSPGVDCNSVQPGEGFQKRKASCKAGKVFRSPNKAALNYELEDEEFICCLTNEDNDILFFEDEEAEDEPLCVAQTAFPTQVPTAPNDSVNEPPNPGIIPPFSFSAAPTTVPSLLFSPPTQGGGASNVFQNKLLWAYVGGPIAAGVVLIGGVLLRRRKSMSHYKRGGNPRFRRKGQLRFSSLQRDSTNSEPDHAYLVKASLPRRASVEAMLFDRKIKSQRKNLKQVRVKVQSEESHTDATSYSEYDTPGIFTVPSL